MSCSKPTCNEHLKRQSLQLLAFIMHWMIVIKSPRRILLNENMQQQADFSVMSTKLRHQVVLLWERNIHRLVTAYRDLSKTESTVMYRWSHLLNWLKASHISILYGQDWNVIAELYTKMRFFHWGLNQTHGHSDVVSEILDIWMVLNLTAPH